MRHSICTDHLLWAVRSAISQQTAGLLVLCGPPTTSMSPLFVLQSVPSVFPSAPSVRKINQERKVSNSAEIFIVARQHNKVKAKSRDFTMLRYKFLYNHASYQQDGNIAHRHGLRALRHLQYLGGGLQLKLKIIKSEDLLNALIQ